VRRTQILLEEWQAEALRTLSEREGKSVSSVIRELVTRRLDVLKRAGSIEDIAGIVHGRRSPGKGHDAVIYRRRGRSKK
jgi:predicted CopG family antitoxin